MHTMIEDFKSKEMAAIRRVAQAREMLHPFEPSTELKTDSERITKLHDSLRRYCDALLDLVSLYTETDWTEASIMGEKNPSDEALNAQFQAKAKLKKTSMVINVINPQVDAALSLSAACGLMRNNRLTHLAHMGRVLDFSEQIEMYLGMAFQSLEKAKLDDYGFINSRVLENVKAHYRTQYDEADEADEVHDCDRRSYQYCRSTMGA